VLSRDHDHCRVEQNLLCGIHCKIPNMPQHQNPTIPEQNDTHNASGKITPMWKLLHTKLRREDHLHT
jgi:hypothetical protein